MNASSILFERVNLFNSVFSSILSEIGYFETKLIFERLDCSNMEFPYIPSVEGIWSNNQSKIEFRFRIYENYITYFEIRDARNNKKLSFEDFKKHRSIDDVEIYLMSGNINQKYEEYLQKTLELIKISDLWLVLNNEKWIEIPFDWQNQK